MGKIPQIGDKIYVPTSLYLSRGADYVIGGEATIKKVISEKGYCLFVEVREHPGCEYFWKSLLSQQSHLRVKFGNQKARQSPDLYPKSNCWTFPGNIVEGEKIDHFIL